MVARQKAARKRPHADPVHRYLDDLAHYKQQKPEIKTETAAPLPNSNNPTSGDFEDLEKDITPFRKYLLSFANVKSVLQYSYSADSGV